MVTTQLTANFMYFQAERRFDYGGHVIVKALPPIESSEFDDVDDLLQECRKQMEATYAELNKELKNEINNNTTKRKNDYQYQNAYSNNNVASST